MFKKRKCPHCNEKISDSFNFCPYCRAPIEEDTSDWGMLGKNDLSPADEEFRLPFGFNMLFNTFNSLMKSFDNQFKELKKLEKIETEKPSNKSTVKKGGISISISTSGNKPPEIKISSFGNLPKKVAKNEPLKINQRPTLPSGNPKKFLGLPKQEPETNIRRLSDRIIYEVKLPGVKSLENISIVQLENSIEIKALAKDKVFSKIIPMGLPIRDYSLAKGKLTLELDARD